MFTEFIKREHDGTRECNYINIEDEQCSLCMEWVIYDWHISKSFKRHDSGHSICIDCQTELKELGD